MLNLINDVLDITKIETGKMTLHCETFELSTIIHQMISSVQPLMEKRCNTLQIHLDDILGEMYADVTKLRQILLNLLSNAAKFTENGTITLKVTSTSDKSGFNFIITDTGIGMNAAQINDLFQLFTQVDSSATRKYGGAGLGLAIIAFPVCIRYNHPVHPFLNIGGDLYLTQSGNAIYLIQSGNAILSNLLK